MGADDADPLEDMDGAVGVAPVELLSHAPDEPRRFFLHRWADASGVSGTGRVAYGVAWPDGRAITRWIGSGTGVSQICVWDSIDEILRIHGHGGATELHWLDETPSLVEDIVT